MPTRCLPARLFALRHPYAVTDNSDWRLMGQETWLSGRQLRWSAWWPSRDDWDHDHCAFCQAEFAEVKTDHVDHTAGYVTADDNYTWICPTCFEDFQKQFGWVVTGTQPPA